jgi:TonB family protein
MVSRLPFLIIPLALAPQSPSGSRSITDQAARAVSCGQVIDVSCPGPSSPATLLVVGLSTWRIVIPAEERHLFGTRIENRYEDHRVCVEPRAWATAQYERVTVRDPSQIVVEGDTPESIRLPDEVARTCDADVQLPVLVRQIRQQIPTDAMRAKTNGIVMLRGVVDRSGAVRDVRVVRSLEPSLDVEASHAFSQWEFRPGRRNGEPVPMAISVEMTFMVQ